MPVALRRIVGLVRVRRLRFVPARRAPARSVPPRKPTPEGDAQPRQVCRRDVATRCLRALALENGFRPPSHLDATFDTGTVGAHRVPGIGRGTDPGRDMCIANLDTIAWTFFETGASLILGPRTRNRDREQGTRNPAQRTDNLAGLWRTPLVSEHIGEGSARRKAVRVQP
jgi:hypothetical protein